MHRINKVQIFDDCSLDNTSNKVNLFKENTALEILFCSASKNSGRPSRGRNLGIMLTESEFLMFLDANDLLYQLY